MSSNGQDEIVDKTDTVSKPFRIIIYALNFAPELTGVGRYTGDMASHLTKIGHDVQVITSYPYYPEWRLHTNRPYWRWSNEVWQGVQITRCPIWVCQRPTAITRVLHLLSFVFSSCPAVLWSAITRRPDVLFVVEPTSMVAPIALLAARLSGAEAWLHVQDIELGAALKVGLINDGWKARIASALYKRLLSRFDRVTTLSNRMRTALASMGRPESQIELFPNWVDVGKYSSDVASNFRTELGIAPGEFVALYAGAMGQKQGVVSLLDAASLVQPHEKKIRLILCGTGSARATIEKQLHGHPNVILLDPLPDDRFIQLLSIADCHLLPQRSGVTHYVMPSKLGPMLATGKPIIAQAESDCEVRQILLDMGNIVIEPENTIELANALLKLASVGSTDRNQVQITRTAELFGRQVILSQAFRHLTALCKQSASGQEIEHATMQIKPVSSITSG